MNRFVIAVGLVLGLCWAVGISHATTAASKPEEAAQATAELWLPLVDTEKYAESWDKMSPDFKGDVGKAKWISIITEIRKPLGKLVARKLKSAEFSRDLPGAPEGEYVVLKYDTEFEKKQVTVETVTTILSQDLVWYVTGYSVK